MTGFGQTPAIDLEARRVPPEPSFQRLPAPPASTSGSAPSTSIFIEIDANHDIPFAARVVQRAHRLSDARPPGAREDEVAFLGRWGGWSGWTEGDHAVLVREDSASNNVDIADGVLGEVDTEAWRMCSGFGSMTRAICASRKRRQDVNAGGEKYPACAPTTLEGAPRRQQCAGPLGSSRARSSP